MTHISAARPGTVYTSRRVSQGAVMPGPGSLDREHAMSMPLVSLALGAFLVIAVILRAWTRSFVRMRRQRQRTFGLD